MKEYLMLIFSALLLAVGFALNKLYQRRAGTSLSAGFFFNSLVGLATAAIFFCLSGCSFDVSLYSILMSASYAITSMLYTLIGFKILCAGSMALYTLVLMVGGMTVPYIWGVLFLDEKFSWLRTLGLMLLITAMVVSNLNKKGTKANVPMLVMCLAVFLLNGLVSVTSKMHQVETVYPTVSASQFVMLGGCSKFIVGGIAFLVSRRCEKRSEYINKNAKPKLYIVLPIIVVFAVTSGVSYLLQLIGASNLPASVLYPFITGGSTVFSTLVGATFFKEKLSKGVIAGVALSFIGTLLFL